MILNDFSSLVHRSIHYSVSRSKAKLVNGKYRTEDFINFTLHRILMEIIEFDIKYSKVYGNTIICLDDHSKRYWRRDVYEDYKKSRRAAREESEIQYEEIFVYINELVEVLRSHSPWKVFEVPGAEADDTIAILAKRYSQFEPVLIVSPDKDMIQVHKYGNIKQYSCLTNKFITEETKGSKEDWRLSHVILGDESDGVPKIVDECNFSENFKKHLINSNCPFLEVLEFEDNLTREQREVYFSSFDVYKTNRKGEPTELDIYEKPRFGKLQIKKNIELHGSLEKWLESDELLKRHYERNAILVLEENIPQELIVDTIDRFNTATKTFSKIDLDNYLTKFRLSEVKMEFQKILHRYDSYQEPLSASNCGW